MLDTGARGVLSARQPLAGRRGPRSSPACEARSAKVSAGSAGEIRKADRAH